MEPAKIIKLVLVVALITAVVSAQAQTDKSSTAGKDAALVNIELSNTSVKEAIDTLFKGTGRSYFILPGVTGNVVDLKLKGITFDEALRALADAAGLEYTFEDGIYTVGPVRSMVAAAPAQPVGTGPQTGVAPEKPVVTSDQTKATTVEPRTAAPPPEPVTQGSTQVIINQAPAPVYYGHPTPVPYGYNYPPVQRFGNVSIVGGFSPVLVAGGSPYILNWGRRFPPPPGWVSPEVMRFLRGQWAIQQGPYFITPY